jgi:hypothetical protein
VNTWVVNSELVALLSKITDQPLEEKDVNPSLVFIATLLTILRGVILMDKVVELEEEEQLLATLKSFINGNEKTYEMTSAMLAGVEIHQVYLDPNAIVTLSTPLPSSVKLLLIGLGYIMSASDGDIDFRERLYLQSIASRLQVDGQQLALLDTCFTEGENVEPETLSELLLLLDPYRVGLLDTAIVQAAGYLYQKVLNLRS